MKVLLIILFVSSFLFSKSLYRVTDSNIVKDNINKLIWIDNKSVVKNYLSHKKAEPYCEKLIYAGFSNWRLPTLKEFKTIVNKKNHRTYIKKVFRYNKATGYWADKAHIRTFWFYADYMNFISGTPYYDNRNKKKLVRCVSSMN
ncbi:MAG: DUF1566 domain-containing protein [Campylobacteraceae bacterium]|nr:DUF1566 domain-containing protein [Campylobacteraceae bacterium]